jgi:signal transduction histidine kinase
VEEPPVEVRAVIYRIVQEAIANVRKHSEAENVEIVLEPRQGGVLARIRDDGVGFDIEQIGESGSEHVGLSNMRERAEMAGGWCRISSAFGAGTVVELWVPSATPRPDADVRHAGRSGR